MSHRTKVHLRTAVARTIIRELDERLSRYGMAPSGQGNGEIVARFEEGSACLRPTEDGLTIVVNASDLIWLLGIRSLVTYLFQETFGELLVWPEVL